jgi:peptidoglycan hydrolase-like protein with peptidoglycan-binding domain
VSALKKKFNIFFLVSPILLVGCGSEIQTDDKYAPCVEYKVVSERDLPLVKCDQSRLLGSLQEILGVPVTGKFDVGTVIAVEGFQLAQGLDVTRIIDIETINRISEISENGMNGKSCLFNISQPLRPWKKCDYNNEIIPFQRFLGVEADGFIGPGTANAIEQFQLDNGLLVTGVIDDATWNRYLKLAN